MSALAWFALSALAFEPNQGQADRSVDFVARGPGYRLSLSGGEALLARQDAVLRLRFAGASRARAAALEPLPGYSQYYLGGFRARAPHYGSVRYQNLYPGIDLVYHGKQGELEYDLEIAPGADPERIRLVFEGARRLRLDSEGDLVVETAAGMVRQKRPRIYQDGRRVEGSYVLLGGRRVGFRAGNYDRSRPVTIDPILRFASFLGGSGDDRATGVAVDAAGNVYVTGVTTSTTFPPGRSQAPGVPDVFLTKLLPAGAAIAFSVYLGGTGEDRAAGVAVDASGNVYVAGTTSSPNFPLGGALRGPSDAFVARLDSSGALLSVAYLAGSGTDSASGLAIDAVGSVYVAGNTDSSDFPVTPGALRTFRAGGGDAFVVKLAGGTNVAYATYLGGIERDQAWAIAVDPSGSAYVAGATASADFPVVNPIAPGRCTQSPTPFGPPCADAFIARLNPAGSGLLYSTFLGGYGNDAAQAIAVDASGNAYVAGVTNSVNFPTHSAVQASFGGGAEDGFAAKFGPAGNLVWSTYLGGPGQDTPYGIAVDAAGSAWVTGATSSSSGFPLVGPLSQRPACPDPCADAFLTQFSPAGDTLAFSTYLGGPDADRALALAVDSVGAVYVAGETASANFPLAGAVQPALAGRTDAFLVRVGEPNPFPVLTSLNPASLAAGGFAFTLTLTGANFVPGAVVRWNGEDRRTTFVSSTELRAEILGGDIATPGTAQVVVFNPPPGGGVSNSLPFLIGRPGAPTISSISPTRAVVGDPGLMLSVTGSGFLPSSAVRWNGAERPTTFISSSRLSAAIPAADFAAAGTVTVTVFSPPPGSGESNAVSFQIDNPIPVLTGMSPASASAGGPSFSLTVTGSRFVPGATVRWNGADRTTSFVSPNELRALIPASDIAAAGAALVSVFNPSPGGGSSSVLSFTITTAPVISPGGIVNAASYTQPLTAGLIGTVFGSNLAAVTIPAGSVPLPTALGGVTVRVEGVEAPLFYVSPLQINFLVPWEVQGRPQVSIAVTSAGVTGGAQLVALSPAAPAIFSAEQRGGGQGAILIAGTGVLAAPRGAFPGSRPARRGEYLEIYASGLGPVSNRPASGAAASADPLSTTTTVPAVAIGGVPAPVLFSGLAAGFVGLYQVNVQVPEGVAPGAAVPVSLTVGGAVSNTVTMAVE